MSSIASAFAPIHRQGWPFVAGFAVATLLLFWLWAPLGWIGLGLTAWCAYFFRDPARVTPTRAGLVISPADGVVSQITLASPPAELNLGPTPRLRIAVFMNVFDCHVNRAPISGVVTTAAYRPGKFLNASLDKASEDNERMGYVFRGDDGREVAAVQIAGLVARRIVSWTGADARRAAGERIGMIRFGSRVDVYLDPAAKAQVAVGQRCVAGETVLCDLDAPEEAHRAGAVR